MFDIHNIAFSILNYPLSWIELLGVITGLAAVYLAAKNKVINFYIALVNSFLYFLIFYQYQLYSMMLLQVVYFTLSAYGIYSWSHPNKKQEKLGITLLNAKARIIILVAILIAGFLWGTGVIHFAELFPENIEKPAYPYIDAVLTMASVVAEVLLTRKKVENWAIWMAVDFSSVILYAVIGIYFTAVLYAVYFVIGTNAFFAWRKEVKSSSSSSSIKV